MRSARPLRSSRFWRAHGHVTEARRWLALGLELGTNIPSDVRADALWTAARQAAAQSDWYVGGWTARRGVAAVSRGRTQTAGRVHAVRARASSPSDVTISTVPLCSPRSRVDVARPLGDPRATSAALLTLAEIRSSQGRHDSALERIEEASICVASSATRCSSPMPSTTSAGSRSSPATTHAPEPRSTSPSRRPRARRRAPHRRGAEDARRARSLRRRRGYGARSGSARASSSARSLESDPDRAASLTALGGVEALRGRPDEAAQLFAEALALRRGVPPEAPERAVLDRFYASRSDESMAPLLSRPET